LELSSLFLILKRSPLSPAASLILWVITAVLGIAIGIVMVIANPLVIVRVGVLANLVIVK